MLVVLLVSYLIGGLALTSSGQYGLLTESLVGLGFIGMLYATLRWGI